MVARRHHTEEPPADRASVGHAQAPHALAHAQLVDVCQGGTGAQDDRLHDKALDVVFDGEDLLQLLLFVHVVVNKAQASHLRCT